MKTALTLLLATLLSVSTAAETVSASGFDIHYNVFASTFLSPQVAEAYDIVRSRERAVLNVTVRRPSQSAAGEAQAAIVSGTVFDLVHRRPLEFVEVREQDAIYYLAQLRFRDRETLYFTLDIQATADAPVQRIEFRKTFYREP